MRTFRNRPDSRELPGVALFGRSMRAAFGMPRAPVLEVRDLRFGPLAVTELRFDAQNFGRSAPVPEQDAVLVSWQLRTNPKHDIWEDGKRLPIEGSDLPLADVAVACGFADQSHFTKVFRRWAGVSPGSLRTASRFETAPKPRRSDG